MKIIEFNLRMYYSFANTSDDDDMIVAVYGPFPTVSFILAIGGSSPMTILLADVISLV
jgi:hypothetical protein